MNTLYWLFIKALGMIIQWKKDEKKDEKNR